MSGIVTRHARAAAGPFGDHHQSLLDYGNRRGRLRVMPKSAGAPDSSTLTPSSSKGDL